jgi:hypothetical protein
MRRSRPPRGCQAIGKKVLLTTPPSSTAYSSLKVRDQLEQASKSRCNFHNKFSENY